SILSMFGQNKGNQKIIGISGSSGKTTLTHILYELFANSGKQSAYISSIGSGMSNGGNFNYKKENVSKGNLKKFITNCDKNEIEFIFVEFPNFPTQFKNFD